MNNLKYEDYDMRSDFTFNVYITDQLEKLDESGFMYVNLENSVPGLIRKIGDDISLDLSIILEKKDIEMDGLIFDGSNKVLSEKDFGTLYGTTWDGKIQFMINRYNWVGDTTVHNFGLLSLGGVASYKIHDITLKPAFVENQPRPISRSVLFFDHIHDWFALHHNRRLANEEFRAEISYDMVFKDQKFKCIINGFSTWKINGHESITSTDSNIILEFEKGQTKDSVFEIAIQLRNFFQFATEKNVGLYKMLLCEEKFADDQENKTGYLRQNWIMQQSFLPPKPRSGGSYPAFNYRTIEAQFEKILCNFLASEKLQNLLTRYLAVSQYRMPVNTVLLTLSSAVESYLKDERYSNGKIIKDFEKKLNIVFNGNVGDNEDTKSVIGIIKNNRDYYIHGDKIDSKLSEIDLIPIVQEFLDQLKIYIKKEIFENYE